MSKSIFSKIFEETYWETFAQDIYQKLQNESVLITSLPEGGQRFFLNYMEELIQIEKSQKIIPIYFEIISKQTNIYYVSSKIRELINHRLDFPQNLSDLSCDLTIDTVAKKNQLVIIINRFERLIESPETMSFLESLRANHPGKVHFLISCEHDCITNPENYQQAGVLTSSNISYLPTFNQEEIKHSIKVLNKFYNWNVPIKFYELIFELSGGLSGLIKYSMKYIHENGSKNTTASAMIKKDPSLQKKLKLMKEILKKTNLIKNGKINRNENELLLHLGILDNQYNLRIGLLDSFLDNFEKDAEDNNLHESLSAQEYKVFKLFSDNKDIILSLDDISKQIWGDHVSSKYSLWALYKVISNINKKLNKEGTTIKNIRGRGYQLLQRNNSPQ